MKPSAASSVLVLLLAAAVSAQTFDAVSIKRNRGGGPTSFSNPPGAFTMTGGTTLILILQAYGRFPSSRIEGLPAWVRDEGYDVTARASGELPFEQRGPSMQALLADRFKLKTHTETRTVEAYALVLARPDRSLGPQARPAVVDCLARAQAERSGSPVAPLPAANANGIVPCTTRWNRGEMRAGSMSMSNLTLSLGGLTGRLVVDRTGLTGSFEMSMSHADADVLGDVRPSLFTALQEQLGLKLEPTSAQTEYLIVDRIERPTED
jgi:uncharacterized protein (TIGR03435 family)